MSPQRVKLYYTDDLSFKEKFMYLMNLLVINQSNDIFKSFFFLVIFSLQNISIYFTEPAGVLNYKNNTFDNFLFQIARIIRFKALLFYNRSYYNLAIYSISIYYIIFTILYIIMIYKTNRKTTYTQSLHFLNFFIKVNIYILSNIIIDFFTRMLCFNQIYNSNIPEIRCDQSNNLTTLIISLLSIIYSSITCIFIHYFYEDNFLLSNSNFNSITSKLFLLQHLKAIIDSFALGLISELTHDFFFIMNIISSSIVFYYYINRLVYYRKSTNIFYGLTYFMNLYSSIYFYIFYHVNSSQKGLIYIISSFFIGIFFRIIFNNIIIKIVKTIPYHKISNPYFLLYYINFILNLTNEIEDRQESKSLLKALIEMHQIECPSNKCITKNNQKIYLPKTNQWSNRKIPFIIDQIFLKNYILYVIKYFLVVKTIFPELLINLSHYYLSVIGNNCLSIYYYNRAKEMELNMQENFLLERLKIKITNKLNDNFKEEGEICSKLIEMNPTLYFKYHTIGDQFIEEINNDLDLGIEFWEIFSLSKNPKVIYFKKVFDIIEKIKASKNNIENLWKKLYELYPGLNIYFYIYKDYVNEINDNSNLNNELEIIKRRKENINESIINNYYNILFKEDTAIIIVNGENGKEGLIEKANLEFGKIFHCNHEKIRGKKINEFMPKIFSNSHNKFMKHYYNIGEKKILDKESYKIFALDSSNSVIQLQKYLKIFPILNENIHYIAMLVLDKIDDIILLNQDFIIQGLSRKLKDRFSISNNKNLFIFNNIPFYMICKNFISFYKTFFKENKKLKNTILYSRRKSLYDEISETQLLLDEEENDNENKSSDLSNTDFNENIEVNENMEIEYEIKFPEFLIKYSQCTRHFEQHNNSDFSSTAFNNIIDEDSKINCADTTLINKIGNSTIVHNINAINDINNINNINNITGNISDEKPSFSNLHINNFVNYNPFSFNQTPDNNATPNYTPIFDRKHTFKKSKIDFQINGRKNIQLYQILFQQEKFEELENLFDSNTQSNYLSFRFNFSFERLIFHNNNFFYLIRCIDNNKQKDYYNENSDSNLPSYCNHKIIKDKINSLNNLNEINKLEKEKLEQNVKNFLELKALDNHLTRKLKQNYHSIKFNSRIHGEQINENTSIITDENSSLSPGSSFNNHVSKLNKIIESRNKILQNEVTSKKIIYLKIITFLLLIIVIIFVFLYDQLYNKSKKKLDFIREYNNLLFSGQILMIRIVNRVVDYSILFYVKYYNYNITLNYGFNSEKEFIIYSKEKAKKWYNESMVKINYLERYILDIVEDPINKVWFKMFYDYQIEVPWNDSDYFPVIAKNSLYNSYYLFCVDDLFNFNNNNNIEDNFFIVSYTSYNSINGVIKYILPKLIHFIPILLSHYLNYSNNLFFLFQILLFIFAFIALFFFFIMAIVTFLAISQINSGIMKVTKISQDNVENIILKIKKFKIDLNDRLYPCKNFFNLHNKTNNDEKKSESDKSLTDHNNNIQIIYEKTKKFKLSHKTLNININQNNNTFSLDRQKLNKITFQKFIIIYFALNFITTIFFLFIFYHKPKELIYSNSSLLKSHTYILEQFLYTTVYLFQMKSIFANFTDLMEINIDNIVNESLSYDLYDSLPEFNEFNSFYYNAFLFDACLALYEEKSENYINCSNKEIVHSINNTNALQNYIIRKIDKLTIIFYFRLFNENINGYLMFAQNEYIEILDSFNNFYIPVYERFDSILNNSFDKKSKFIKYYTNLLLVLMIGWSFTNILYQYYFYIPFLKKMIKISTNFIEIIPSNFILETPDLENWLEKVESG